MPVRMLLPQVRGAVGGCHGRGSVPTGGGAGRRARRSSDAAPGLLCRCARPLTHCRGQLLPLGFSFPPRTHDVIHGHDDDLTAAVFYCYFLQT